MTTTTTATTTPTEGLSKSQKKRLKQKAKKQRDLEAQEAEAAAATTKVNGNATTSTPKAPVDPNNTLVETLLEQGFTREQISKAQEKLWEAVGSGEGGYDDIWAVSDLLVKLYGGDGGSDDDDDDDDEEDSDYEDESGEESDSEDSGEYEEEGDLEVEKKGDEVQLKEEQTFIPTKDDTFPQNQEKQHNEDEPQPRPLSEKLDYVAKSVPQLADALFALTEWTNKSASRSEVERHFLELKLEESSGAKEDGSDAGIGPLRTIIERVLLYQPQQQQQQQQMDPSALVAGCANLLTCVLLSPACNVNVSSTSMNTNGAAHSSTMKKALGELLRRGRVLASQFGNTSINVDSEELKQGPTPEQVASSISNSVLELLQRASAEKTQREKRLLNGYNNDNRSSGANSSVSSSGNNNNNSKQPIQFTSQGQAQSIVRQMEGEIASLMVKIVNKQRMMPQQQQRSSSKRTLPPTSFAVVDLMSRRDRTKQIAEKSGVVLEVSAGCKKMFESGGDDNDEGQTKEGEDSSAGDQGEDGEEEKKNTHTQSQQKPQGKFQSEESKEALAQKIIGASLFTTLASSINEVKSYEEKMDQILSNVATEQINLSTRQTSISSKRAEISKRMEQIRRELEELERQDEQLVKEEKEISSELDRLDRRSDKEIEGLKSKIAEKSVHVTVDREVKRTVDKLGELEMAWIRSSSNSSSAAVESEAATPVPPKPMGPPITELLPIKLDQYLNRARSYFQSESQCVEFLRNRVSTAEAEVLDLERELQECIMLEMSTNVETLSQNLRTLKSHVDEDNAVIDALRGDAKKMRAELIRRVEEYIELMKTEDGLDEEKDGVLTPSHVASLEGISIELTGIGFYDDLDGGLGAIFAKIPKRGNDAAEDTAAVVRASPTFENDNSSYIGTVDGSSPSPLTIPLDKAVANGHTLPSHVPGSVVPVVAKPAMPKFSWATKANNVPKKETRSLLDIQREELSAKQNGQ